MLRKSGFNDRMRDLCQAENKHFYVYGDPAYRLSLYILRGYKGARSRLQAVFSILMNKLHVSVEWGFGHVVQDRTYLGKKKNMKWLRQQNRGKFKCKPPSLHDYLHSF